MRACHDSPFVASHRNLTDPFLSYPTPLPPPSSQRAEADRRGLTLDRESFETALGAVASAKQPARALDLLKAMREAGAGAPERGVVSALVEMCRELDEAALAEELARDFGPLP